MSGSLYIRIVYTRSNANLTPEPHTVHNHKPYPLNLKRFEDLAWRRTSWPVYIRILYEKGFKLKLFWQ